MNEQGELCWFVMKAMNNRATTAKALLDKKSITSFVPMKLGVKINNKGGKRVVMSPLLPSLIFVKAASSTIWELNRTCDFLFALYDRTASKSNWGELMVVPTQQMEEFIEFVEGNQDKIVDIDPSAVDLKKGERVKITSGAFEGKVATYVSVKGKRSRQIVVKIDGFTAVMATSDFTIERIS